MKVKGDEDMMLGIYKATPDLHLTIEHLVTYEPIRYALASQSVSYFLMSTPR